MNKPIRYSAENPGTRVEPAIKWNHVDGPVITFSDGQCHSLTVGERLSARIGITDAEKLQKKHRPDLT